METFERDDFDGPTIDISFYVTERLLDHAPFPGTVAARHMAKVLDLAEINYTIYYRFPAQNMPERSGDSMCDEPFQTWNQKVIDGDIPLIAKDANVLCIETVGGGCGTVNSNKGPDRGVFGAKLFDEFKGHELYADGSDRYYSACVHAMLHEVGHQLGFSHEPHGGYGFNVDEEEIWVRTPVVGGNDVENYCGEWIEDRQYTTAHKYLFYHWCAISNFNVEGTDETPGLPSEYPPTLDGELPPHAERLSHYIDVNDCRPYEKYEDITIKAGQSTQFWADITNNTESDLLVDIYWTVDGVGMDEVLDERINAESSKEVTSSWIDYQTFRDEFDTGTYDLDISVENVRER